ncbi:Zinc metalloproteinase nas-14 [Larimichthys crocea]|uniref:Uncharacterized protein n=1 Tax=Larimichthys crocea TaxID=215358 RepID=A0ACD3QGL0_LARCR|nr:Zinc metalloproteinase nas-14 [Larimichthys crocea]
MDDIIKANEFHASRIIDGTTSLREGDIAVTAGRRSKVCFARSCLWSKCWSYLGARGGRQTVSLQSPDCLRVGVISHEFMHALGFVHEQSRFDRDNYVTVMWPNIWRDRLRNFEKFKTDNLNLPYDYGSIMHFGMYAYSQDGEPTIVPKNIKNIKLGQTSSLSHIDKLKINKLYQCGDADDY